MTENTMITVHEDNVLAIELLVDTAMNFAQLAKAKNTRKTYANGWRSFELWCAKHQTDPMTSTQKEGLIALWASDMAKSGTMKISTIDTYLAAICSTYKERGIGVDKDNHALKLTLTGIKKTMTSRPTKKSPVLTEDIQEMLKAISVEENGRPRLIGLRDKALLLLGFAGAFRRSELVALCLEDVKFERDGFRALIRRSKTDQEGAGTQKTIPYGANPATCPVRALKDWISSSGIISGPIFRHVDRHGNIATNALSGFAVGQIIKRNAYIQSKDAEKYSGHSLRAGFVTEAARRNIRLDLIMKQTGHKTIPIVMEYIRNAEGYGDSAAAMVGL